MNELTHDLDVVAGGNMPSDGGQTDLPPPTSPWTGPMPPLRRTNG